MSTTTGPYPPQMAHESNTTIGDSFHKQLPDYSYNGASHACSEGGTITKSTAPPKFCIETADLWHDMGNRFIEETIGEMKKRWIELQPIWAFIKQIYDNAYRKVYAGISLTGNQAPGNVAQAIWDGCSNQQQRAMIVERLAEEAGKREAQQWVQQAETQMVTQHSGPLAASPAIALAWARYKVNYQLDQEHIYQKETAARHLNESDVVRTAGMYLVYPVLVALNSDPAIYSTIGLQSEDTHNQVRSDITFYRSSLQGKPRPVAILEFKRRGVIKPHQFHAAILQGGTTANLNQQQPGQPNGTTRLQHARNLSGTKTKGTMFEDTDAYRLMRQASAYAMEYRTRHVALCDWNYLVLCNFVAMPYPTPPNKNPVGDYVEIQILRIGTPDSGSELRFLDAMGSEQFRPALLGFLKDAYEKTP